MTCWQQRSLALSLQVSLITVSELERVNRIALNWGIYDY